MAENIGPAPFELDEARSALDGRRRTTPDSIRIAVRMLVEAQLLPESDSDLPDREIVFPMGEQLHEGKFVDVAADCDPDHLSTGWHTGFVAYVGIIKSVQTKLRKGQD